MENNVRIGVKTTQIESLRTNKDEIINLEVLITKNWKNW